MYDIDVIDAAIDKLDELAPRHSHVLESSFPNVSYLHVGPADEGSPTLRRIVPVLRQYLIDWRAAYYGEQTRDPSWDAFVLDLARHIIDHHDTGGAA